MLLPFLSHSNFSRPLRQEEYKACVKNVPIDMSKVSYHVNDIIMLMGYTLTSACIFSILFSKHFCGAYTENSCNIQEPINSW